MSTGYPSSWEFYKDNNTDSLKSLLENLGGFYSVKFYSTGLCSVPEQLSIGHAYVAILHDNILRARRDMPMGYGSIRSRPVE